MIVKNISDVPLQDVNMDGARDVKVKVVYGPTDRAPNFAMRIFELAPGGHTPFHSHPFEHEAVILEGKIASVSSAGTIAHAVNDALLIFPGEEHQFRNLSANEPAKFMCLVPVEYQK
jgi:quercetin dioxygenase-like cupin family protein